MLNLEHFSKYATRERILYVNRYTVINTHTHTHTHETAAEEKIL
jgi:hypothetical protein